MYILLSLITTKPWSEFTRYDQEARSEVLRVRCFWKRGGMQMLYAWMSVAAGYMHTTFAWSDFITPDSGNYCYHLQVTLIHRAGHIIYMFSYKSSVGCYVKWRTSHWELTARAHKYSTKVPSDILSKKYSCTSRAAQSRNSAHHYPLIFHQCIV
jgi:hypothetical protein